MSSSAGQALLFSAICIALCFAAIYLLSLIEELRRRPRVPRGHRAKSTRSRKVR
jgi:hypothetical protein